jgi:hypothetical protein
LEVNFEKLNFGGMKNLIGSIILQFIIAFAILGACILVGKHFVDVKTNTDFAFIAGVLTAVFPNKIAKSFGWIKSEKP